MKDKKWLKKEVWKQDIVMDKGYIYTDDLMSIINQLDEPEVAEEPKYYVDLDTAAYVAKWEGDGSVQIYTDSVSGSDEYELHLTEQEIKDYDERFWAFAVPVEEVPND